MSIIQYPHKHIDQIDEQRPILWDTFNVDGIIMEIRWSASVLMTNHAKSLNLIVFFTTVLFDDFNIASFL